ncbi:MAG: CRTAC1 family protein [Planctomycetaceae bacterium]
MTDMSVRPAPRLGRSWTPLAGALRASWVLAVVWAVAGCGGRGPGDRPAAAPGPAGAGRARQVDAASADGRVAQDAGPAATVAAAPAAARVGGRSAGASRERDRGAVRPVFDDVARSSGIDFTYDRDVVPDRWLVVEVMGGGVAWIDYDRDGWLDLFLTNGGRIEYDKGPPRDAPDRLFRSQGRDAGGAVRFHDVTASAAAGEPGYGQGVAVGDYDADGFPDLYLANYGPNALLRNNGDGTFSVVTGAAGVGDDKWGTGAVFTDLDFDGILDIYCCNFLDNIPANARPCFVGAKVEGTTGYTEKQGYCGPGNYRGDQDAVYRGRGDGSFERAEVDLGFVEREGAGKGLCVAVADLDDDLKPEIYVGNDMTPNYLYVPRGDPVPTATGSVLRVRYEEVAFDAGCAVSDQGENEATMGIVCEDLNDDALPDIFLCHFYKAKNTLYHNLGKLQFADESRRTRIAATSFDNLGFGTVALDWDRDGRLDLFNATGHVLGPNYEPEHMPPQLLRRVDRERFADVSGDVAGSYFSGSYLGRGVAGADYDNDGDLDIAVAHNDSPFALLRNDTAAPGRFISLDLVSRNRVPPVGGRVEMTCGAIRMVRPVVAGGSYLASHDPRILFTLPPGEAPAEVTIHWPTGRVDRVSLGGDRHWRVVEGAAPVEVDRDGRPLGNRP